MGGGFLSAKHRELCVQGVVELLQGSQLQQKACGCRRMCMS